VDGFESTTGGGVSGRIGGRKALIGKEKFIVETGIPSPPQR